MTFPHSPYVLSPSACPVLHLKHTSRSISLLSLLQIAHCVAELSMRKIAVYILSAVVFGAQSWNRLAIIIYMERV
jgi:hypothetical protein